MRCVTKAMPIDFIDGKFHTKQPKSRKCHKTCLTNHTWSISHRIMRLVTNTFGADTHMCMHANIMDETISRNQPYVGLWPVCTWLNKIFMKDSYAYLDNSPYHIPHIHMEGIHSYILHYTLLFGILSLFHMTLNIHCNFPSHYHHYCHY